MYSVDMYLNDKIYGALCETRKTAFGIYYMLVDVCINNGTDWSVELIDWKEHRVINSCDSEFMEGYLD